MKKEIILYHGSFERVIHPEYGKGKQWNDYGSGFYCTAQYALACEWAAQKMGSDGFVNKYRLDLSDLKILDLTKPKYNILNWLTLLLKNRTFDLKSPISKDAKEYLLKNFSIDTSEYDLIKGYRADDSYFSFSEDFLNNVISVQHLERAMILGKLGIQYVLISKKAFDTIIFEDADFVSNEKYYPLYMSRDVAARKRYREEKTNLQDHSKEIYILDLIRGKVKNDEFGI